MTSELRTTGANERPGLSRQAWWTIGLLTLAVIGSYSASFRLLLIHWENPNYSHGYLVLPIAAVILWMRREELAETPTRPSWLGWVGLVALLALRWTLYDRNEMWVEQATIPLVAASLVVALAGWRMLWVALPAIGFLFFLLPLPPSLNAILADPLQQLATIGSTSLLQAFGLPVLAEGNVILVGAERLEVARACNGLSMLASFMTLICAMVLTVGRDRPLWERLVLLLSTLPIALVVNILRIFGTAVLYHAFGPSAPLPWPLAQWYPTVDQLAHDTAGWAMMPVALALIFLEMRVLAWLVVEEETATGPLVFLPGSVGPSSVAKP